MTVSQDPQIFDIQIDLGVAGITRQGFGVPMLVASVANLEAGFTERVRSYATAADVAADADLGALTTARLNAMFGVDRAPNLIKVGRREADVAQVDTVTVTGDADGDYTISINAVDFAHTASGSTVTAIRDALIVLINAGGEPVTAAPVSTDQISLTADVAGTAFALALASTGSAMTSVATTASVSVDSELDAILAADSDFFHVVIDTRVALDITRTASFATTNKRMFWAQSADADIVTSVTTDVFSVLKSQANRWVTPLYYSDAAAYYDARAAAYFAASNFDTEAPTASQNVLAGLAADPSLTSTQLANLVAKGVARYIPFKGVACTSNTLTSAGFDTELVVTGAWTDARMTEAIASLMIRSASAGSRVRFGDLGFRRIDGEADGVLKQGERIGHFNPGTTEVVGTDRANVAAADVTTGTYRFAFGGQYSGRVKDFVIRGIINASFAGLSA